MRLHGPQSVKFIEWEPKFCAGHTLRRELPAKLDWSLSIAELVLCPTVVYENITFDISFAVAPCNIDKAIHKVNRLCKYYTFKEYPGAIRFLGCKL